MALKKRSVLGRELEWNEVDQNWTDIEAAFAQKAGINHSHSISGVSGLQEALDSKIATSARGANNGVASLGADGKVPLTQLPNLSGAGFVELPKSSGLSNADIGKCAMLNDDGEVVVWNPEPDIEGSGGGWSFVFNGITDKTTPAKSYMPVAVFALVATTDTRIKFNFNATDSTPMGSVTFSFVAGTPSTPTEVQIGVDDEETGNNFIDVLQSYIDDNSLAGRISLSTTFSPGLLVVFCEDFTSYPNTNWSLEGSADAGSTWDVIGTFSGGSGGITQFNTPIGIIYTNYFGETATNASEEAEAFAEYLNENGSAYLTATVSGNTVDVFPIDYTQESFDFSIEAEHPDGVVDLISLSEYVPNSRNFTGLHVIPRIHQILENTAILQVSGVVELIVSEEMEDSLTIGDINAGIRSGNPSIIFKLCASANGTVIMVGYILFSGETPEDAIEKIAAYVIGTPLTDIIPGQPVKVLLAPSNFY